MENSYLENQFWVPSCWDITAPVSFQQTELGNTCMCVCVNVFFYICLYIENLEFTPVLRVLFIKFIILFCMVHSSFPLSYLRLPSLSVRNLPPIIHKIFI